MKPHKHVEIIKAWADGAQIEVLSKKDREWNDVVTPLWRLDREYRVKPEPKPDEIRYTDIENLARKDQSANLTTTLYSYSNLRLTFDGETGKLKKAEVILETKA